MNLTPAEKLWGEFEKTWPSDWQSSSRLSDALNLLKDNLLESRPCALPFVLNSKSIVVWVIVGRTVRIIRDHFDDVKSWLTTSDKKSVTGEIVKIKNIDSSPGTELALLAPQGYGRWMASIDRGPAMVLRLAQMQRFLATKPDITRITPPTLPALRLAFISALSVGDWSRAGSCIDEIDRWGLDHAAGTLHMRIRLLEAQGAISELFSLVCQNKAWDLSCPRRIACAILESVDINVFQPIEHTKGLEEAFVLFRDDWYPKLYQLVEEVRDEPKVARILAMAATVDQNHLALKRWFTFLSESFASFLALKLPPLAISTVSSTTSTTQEIPNDQLLNLDYWTRLHNAIKSCQTLRVRNMLESLDDAQLSNPNFLGSTPDGLLEILSDPDIEREQTAHLLRQDALATLIDVFVGAPGFPRQDHFECYLALLEGLSSLHSETMSATDSQLLLGLVGAAVHLSSQAYARCTDLVRQWWKVRPLVQRLDWLAGALDTLATVHPQPDQLWDLYLDGLNVASRRGLVFTPVQIRTWESIGRSLEIPPADILAALSTLRPPPGDAFNDPLERAGLKQIAVISLQETSAREAARELEKRTGAKVNVVISSVADNQLRSAKQADLILYVWAATSHATYRSLDSVRERIQYVQGTGSSSILLAAERWAERRFD